MLAWLWPDVLDIEPATRFVVIFRPIPEVESSLARLNVRLPDWFLPEMERRLTYLVRSCSRAIAIDYNQLADPRIAADIWHHCRQEPFDRQRWESLSQENIQSDIQATLKLLRERDGVLKEIFGPRYGRAA